jgi:hypothetical protein
MTDEAVIKIVFGKRGSGKTCKAANLVKTTSRVLFYDTLGHDYKNGVVFLDLAKLKAYWRTVYQKNFRLIYRPDDPERDFPEVCRLVAACQRLTVVVEELDLFFSGGRCCDEFTHLIFRGRHYGVELVGVTQRPRGFGRGLTAMAKEFFIFSTREPDDVKYFRDRLGDEVAEKIQQLDQFNYVEYLDYGGTQCLSVKKDDL